tara:strand:- start:36585 stop:36944 length:360 start_codon:yes stop_codon:yes gene_type:complete
MQVSGWLAYRRRQFGFFLIKLGISLSFYKKDPYSREGGSVLDDDVLNALKDEANRSTLLGSQIETGNHAHGIVQPISNYTAVSIACSLQNLADAMQKTENERVTEDDELYKGYAERWKH